MAFSLINLFGVLVAAWVLGSLATRFGLPAVLGELLAGIVFGPTLLGWIHDEAGLHVLADVGVYLLMLYIGMQVDHRDLKRASWPGLLAALGGLVLPFAAGVLLVRWWGGGVTQGLFMGLAFGVTALTTNSRILVELNLLGTRLTSVILAAALISDTGVLMLFSGVVAFAQTGGVDLAGLAVIAGKAIVFFGVTGFLGLKIFPLVGARLMRAGFQQRTANFTLLLLVALVFAELAELAGLHSILGAFLAGLFVREGVLRKKLSYEISGLVHDLSLGFLAPVFFVASGFAVSLDVLWNDPAFVAVVVVTATAAKMAGVALFYLPARRGWREGVAAGVAMNGRGALDIIIAELGLGLGFINQETYSVLVLMAFFTTALVPLVLKRAVGWLERKNELVREKSIDWGTVIFGAGPLGLALGRALRDERRVVFIDRNVAHVQAAEREGFRVVTGDALRYETLEEAGVLEAQRLIAASSNPDMNSLVAQVARDSCRVPEVYALIPSVSEDGMRHMLLEQGIIPLTGGDVQLGDWERWIALQSATVEEVQVLEPMNGAEAFDIWFRHEERLPLVRMTGGGEITPFRLDQGLVRGDRIMFLSHVAPEGESDRFDALVANAPIIDAPEGIGRDELFDILARTFEQTVGEPAGRIKLGLYAREAQGSTMLSEGIAVPHVEIERRNAISLAIVRARGGIAFEPGKPPVVAVFAIATSREERTTYLRTLSAVAQILHAPAFTQRWQELPDVEALRAFLRTAKRQRL